MGGKEPKVVVIGAGSADFGPVIIADLLLEPALKGSELCLVDIDPEALDLTKGLAERMNTEWKAGCRISAATDRRKLLSGASFVIVSIAIEREKRWRMDWEIPLKFGIRQPLGENGSLASSGSPVKTNSDGIARDVLKNNQGLKIREVARCSIFPRVR
jgi:alpha-galactosidase